MLSWANPVSVFSLLEVPSTKFSTLKDEDVSSSSPADVAKRSLTYFKSVDVLIQDLGKTLRDKTKRDYQAVWMERYARKVDRLPILNVDQELLQYGAKVGETFRSMALAKRQSGIRTGVRKSQTYGNYWYGGSYGYGVRNTGSVRRQIKQEEKGKATTMRFESWKAIEDATAEIRRRMTKEYQIEFKHFR